MILEKRDERDMKERVSVFFKSSNQAMRGSLCVCLCLCV